MTQSPPSLSTSPQRLKLLAYNVQVGIPSARYSHYFTNSWKHLLPFQGRNANLKRIAQFISDYDIVGLLELDAGSIRSEFIHQPEYIADKAGFPYCYHKVNRDLGIVAKHSLAIMSRFEACHVVQHTLPSRIPGRGALEVHFGTSEQPLVVVLAHLSLSAGARSKQLAYIAEIIKPYEDVVLMGDLNAALASYEMQQLLKTTQLSSSGVEHFTYPSWRPRIAYDHILASPSLQPSDAQVFGVKHSDHLPVAINIGIPSSLNKT